jgi:excisionase family DNA binding protein
MKSKLLTVSETAHRLDLSADTIRRYERDGRLEAIKVGKGQRLFTETDVERMRIERQRKQGAALHE